MHLTTQQQQSYRSIKAYLLAPERRAGERLGEKKLGELVGASRTPVRQALIQLAQEGLVEHTPRWGFFVRQPDADEIAELYGIRLRLESFAAQRAAKRATPDDLRQLKATVAEMKKVLANDATNVSRFGAADREFHMRLLEAAHGRWLGKLVNISLLQVGTGLSCIPAPQLRQTLLEHQAVLDALVRRDAETAERLIGEHLSFPKKQVKATGSNRSSRSTPRKPAK